jgi:hypothetical protein
VEFGEAHQTANVLCIDGNSRSSMVMAFSSLA